MERMRIEFPGVFYHVIQRGNNRERIFGSDADKARYFNYLVELKGRLMKRMFDEKTKAQ